MTGAEIVQLDSARARVLTDRIKVGIEGVWHLIAEAYTERAWAALGYSSWDDYCTREFGTSRLRLPREERQEVVSSLREQGLSLRAIATVTGDSVRTIRRELSGGANATPEPVEVDPSGSDEFAGPSEAVASVALDGDTQIIEGTEPDEFDQKIADELARSEGARIDPPPAPEPAGEPAPTVTGTDGKIYSAKSRSAPYRKPLPEVAKSAGWELRKCMERIEKLFDDNRYRQNEEQVATALRGHLLYVAETVAAVLDQLA